MFEKEAFIERSHGREKARKRVREGRDMTQEKRKPGENEGSDEA